MKGYESVIITNPDLSEEDQEGLLEKTKAVIARFNGTVERYHLWGRRRLAYSIKKKQYGVYHILYIAGDGNMLNELQQYYRFADEILRFQTIAVEDIEKAAQLFLDLSGPKVSNTTDTEEKNLPSGEIVDTAHQETTL